MEIKTKVAKSISYGNSRELKSVKYIVIHYTGNNNDTASGNANYFATSNTRQAGAHYFVDKSGNVYCSVPIDKIAWSVGGDQRSGTSGEAKYYNKCTNANSVSIELCDCCTSTNWEQMKATKELINYIQKKCQNAKTIIRHWDVNGKGCPSPMIGANNKKWNHLHKYLTAGYQYEVKIVSDVAVRKTKGVKPLNKIGTLKKGSVVKIQKVVGNWGRLLNKSGGNYQWISLKKTKEI
jgi:N-acetylmuramoyl-L-alanine amidase CwlA